MKGNVGKALADARKEANLGQEQAAERLSMDVRTLSGYENGNPVPIGFFAAARIVYKADADMYMALQHSDIGDLLPQVRKLSKALAFIQMQNQISQIVSLYPRIIEIIEDDIISDEEVQDYSAIKETGSKTAGSILSFIYAK